MTIPPSEAQNRHSALPLAQPALRSAAAAHAPRRTRLAPSPTGTLHLGNARSFLVNWALARNLNWRVLLRIEDLDRTRVRAGAAEQAIDLLRWLGIDWDEGPVFQSHDLEPYRDAMRRLAEAELVYACTRSRKDIERAASAPNLGEGEMRFGAELRPPPPAHTAPASSVGQPAPNDPWRFAREDVNYRLRVPDERIDIDDRFAGRSGHYPFKECGDFMVWTRLGVPAYQLAVVVDDARHGVTDIVRGDDLLPSAARQTLIYRALQQPAPAWWHLPLVLGEDGRRLAKRHGDTHLQTSRDAGVPPQGIIGLLARWCGVGHSQRSAPEPMTADEFRRRFTLDMLSRKPVRFTRDDHAWLLPSPD